MATAGTPAAAMPSAVRSTSSASQLGTKAHRRLSSPDANSEIAMTRLRPYRSEAMPPKKIATVITRVAQDSDRLAAAGDTANTREKIGMSGCTQ